MATLYSLLNRETKTWWYFRTLSRIEARKLERKSILSKVKNLRETLANRGVLVSNRWENYSIYIPITYPFGI